MIRLEYDRAFQKAALILPIVQRQKLGKLMAQFQKNPFDPLLHTKPLSGSLTGFFSFRVSRDWRVMFQFLDEETIRLLDVAHRKDIYR